MAQGAPGKMLRLARRGLGLTLAGGVLALGFTLGGQKGEEEHEEVPPPPMAASAPSQFKAFSKDRALKIGLVSYTQQKPTRCVGDYFLQRVERALQLKSRPQMVKTPLTGNLAGFDLLLLSGEGPCVFSEAERQALKSYMQSGGMVLAFPGFGAEEWDRSFRQELVRIMNQAFLTPISKDQAIWGFPFDLSHVNTRKNQPLSLEGIVVGDRLALIYSAAGLNDSAHVKDCCVCGGNEAYNSWAAVANVLVLAVGGK